MPRPSIVPEVGYPDEMQAREKILDACRELGSKNRFCDRVGISRRYLNLIMEWLRPPTHYKIMDYFGWRAIYATLEDLNDGRFERRRNIERPLGRPRSERHPKTQQEQREYWRVKQRESRMRRRLKDFL